MHRAAHRVLAVLSVMGAACAGPSPAPAEPEPPPRPPLGRLALLVPGGAERVAELRPGALLAAPATRRVVQALVPPDAMRRLADRTGIDPVHVETAVVAEYARGHLVLLRGDFDAAARARELARARMAPVESRSDAPFVRRGGHVGTDWRELVALRADVLAVAFGEIRDVTAAVVHRASQGRWPPSARAALGSESALDLLRVSGEAPASVHMPRPLELPEGFGTSVLLARERALVLVFEPAGEDIEVGVDLRGEFPDGAEQNFRTLVTSVARTDVGAALGLLEGLETLRVQAERSRVVIHERVPADSLARGLVMLLGPDVRTVTDGD
ncbi:MAG: hypothetical protein ACOCXM_07470 [Myxococcota bacterium]